MDYRLNPDQIAARWSEQQIREWSEYQEIRAYEIDNE